MHTIHVIGDSHVGMFFGERNHSSDPMIKTFDQFKVVDMAAGTMAGSTIYGLANEKSEIQAAAKIKKIISSGVENVVMVLGEVDVRWHIRAHRAERSLEEAVAEVITRYEDFVRSEVAPKVSGKVILFGGIPYSQEYAKGICSTEKLSEYTNCFDSQIATMTKRNGWYSIHVLDSLDLVDGHIKKYILLDDVHLDCKKTQPLLMKKLDEIFGPIVLTGR